MFKKFILPISFLCFANPISAKTPQVATDIPPVHSLVAMVMDGVATPGLIMAPGASPHGYSMRPSEAALLEGADVVIWIGEELTPWLEDARGSLADNAENIVLLDVADTHLHAFREDAVFEHHDDHEEDGHDEDGHKEDEHGHDDHGHDHGDIDPHAWLDPENAQIWLGEIAAALSRLDPENSDRYLSNAEAGKARINEVASEAINKLKPVSGEGFVVFHDSIQYFEKSFDMATVGALSLGDATKPSPARVSEIQSIIKDEGVRCVLAEPQYNSDLVMTVIEGTDANAGLVDPLGSTLDLGPDLYPSLLANFAASLEECLSSK